MTIFIANTYGKLVDTHSWKIADQPSDESYDHIRKKGIPFSATTPMTNKNQNLRVVVYDENIKTAIGLPADLFKSKTIRSQISRKDIDLEFLRSLVTFGLFQSYAKRKQLKGKGLFES